MPSTHSTDTALDIDLHNLELTRRNNRFYIIDHNTGDGCYGKTPALAIRNIAQKLARRQHRTPASTERVEEVL